MRTQKFAFVMTILLLISLFVINSVYSEMTDEQFYLNKLEQLIDRCIHTDRRLSGSCLPNMQQYGALNCLKASYISYYRNDIIRGLLYNKIDLKDYKIKQYINEEFFNVFRLANGEFEKQKIKSPYPVEE